MDLSETGTGDGSGNHSLASCSIHSSTCPLLTDLYQLNMIQAYLEHGETKAAVFEFFVRKLPPRRRFLVAAGLEQAPSAPA
jgi:nicotinic acid phosphoribosyltransferase